MSLEVGKKRHQEKGMYQELVHLHLSLRTLIWISILEIGILTHASPGYLKRGSNMEKKSVMCKDLFQVNNKTILKV